MNDLIYLFAALAFVWAGVLVYLFRMAALRKGLQRRIDSIQERLDKMGGLS